MSTIYTTTDVAADRGVTATSVARVARTHGIGTRAGRDWIFTADEAEKLKSILRSGPGNPHSAENPQQPEEKNPTKTR